MESVRHWFGFFHVAVASAVAVQVLVSDSYDADLSDTVWLVLNWLMAVAVITAVVFSYRRWRGTDASARGARVIPSVMLVASTLLLVLYFEQWQSEAGVATAALSELRRVMWLIIDILFVVINATVGIQLLRGWRA